MIENKELLENIKNIRNALSNNHIYILQPSIKKHIVNYFSQNISIMDNIRKVHILEPQWHSTKIEQTIGRCIRVKSNI